MGQNVNIGQQGSLTVYGNPESFKKVISSHGQLCKIKQAISCPCVSSNHGSPRFDCEICNGDGYTYRYQRRFLVTDEQSRISGKIITPYWNPIRSVVKVQNVTSALQGGITELEVQSFSDAEIRLVHNAINYEKKRVTYTFDGWTYVAREKLRVDAVNKLMYADGTLFDAQYQSSNPLGAYADIAQVIKIWNDDTGKELKNYEVVGNTISTQNTVDADNMYIEYYYADITKVINTDVVNRNTNEVWTHDLSSGECKMAFYPFWELTRGDIIVLPAIVLYKNEQLKHLKDLDRLHEIEIFSLNDTILDESGNIYSIDTDFILYGRYIKWIGNKPDVGKWISVRYGYKPSYIIFEDAPQPNSAENKQYPIIVLGKSWSKTTKDDVAKLLA
jgi:hypothetical protein